MHGAVLMRALAVAVGGMTGSGSTYLPVLGSASVIVAVATEEGVRSPPKAWHAAPLSKRWNIKILSLGDELL